RQPPADPRRDQALAGIRGRTGDEQGTRPGARDDHRTSLAAASVSAVTTSGYSAPVRTAIKLTRRGQSSFNGTSTTPSGICGGTPSVGSSVTPNPLAINASAALKSVARYRPRGWNPASAQMAVTWSWHDNPSAASTNGSSTRSVNAICAIPANR